MKKSPYLCSVKQQKHTTMDKVIFKSERIPRVTYVVIGEYWLDDDTYVIIFDDMVDGDGDVFHLETEWHEDEKRITWTRVYEHETLSGEELVSPIFKKMISEYLKKKIL